MESQSSAFPGDVEVQPASTSSAPDTRLLITRQRTTQGCWWGARHTLVLMATLGVMIDYMLQSILPVAIVAMVGRKGSDETVDEVDVCPQPEFQNTTVEAKPGDFDWDERTQGLILGVFYYGCAILPLPGGRLAEMYGGRLVFGLMLACGSVLSIVSPIIAYTSTGLFIAVRVLQGMAVGGMFPAINTMIVNWFPPDERPKFASIIFTGINSGSVVSMSLSGWLSSLEWLGGWPAAFYVLGFLGLVWTGAWFLLIYTHPKDHPRISKEELDYILKGRTSIPKKRMRVPWGAIVTSPWVWVVTLTAMGDTFNLYIILTMLPTYLTNIQHFSLGSAGVIAALPHLLSCVVSIGWGLVVGWLAATHTLSTRRIRQLSMVAAFYIPSACMVGMCLVGCNADIAVVLLTISVSASTCGFAGYYCSIQDLSPNFAGTLLGFTAIFSSLAGVAGPFLTGALINGNDTIGAWQKVFLSSAIVYFVTCTIFLVFTPVRLQPWDSPAPATPPDEPKPHLPDEPKPHPPTIS